MPNFKGGKKFKRQKKVTNDRPSVVPEAVDNQLYGQVERRLGGRHLEIKCSDNKKRIGIIPGSFVRRVWMNANDVVLIDINPLNEKECFILYKYSIAECQVLKSKKLVNYTINEDDDDSESEKEDIFDKIDELDMENENDPHNKKLDQTAKKLIKKEKDLQLKTARDNKEIIDFDSI